MFSKQLGESTVELLVAQVRVDGFSKKERPYNVNEPPSVLVNHVDRETYSLVQTSTNSLPQTIWKLVVEHSSLYARSMSQPQKALVLDVCERDSGMLILYLNKGKLMLDEIHKKSGGWYVSSSLPIGANVYADLEPEASMASSKDEVVICIRSKDTGQRKSFLYSDGQVTVNPDTAVSQGQTEGKARKSRDTPLVDSVGAAGVCEMGTF
jgi:hypothetical protein